MPNRDEGRLSALLSEVNLARAQVRDGRGVHPAAWSREDQRMRCERLADAMEAYAAEAAAAGVPVPYRYRDEMRLYRSVST